MNNLMAEWEHGKDAQIKPSTYVHQVVGSSFSSAAQPYKYEFEETSTQGFMLLYDKRIADMQKAITELKEIVSKLIENENDSVEEEIQLRNISYNKAKAEIKKFFKEHHGENLDAADIQENLRIDISLAMAICEELEQEGKIKEA